MNPIEPSFLVLVGIPALAVALLGLWPLLLWRAAPPEVRGRWALWLGGGLLAWAALWQALAAAGVLLQVDRRPPPFLALPPLLLLGVGLLGRSRVGKALAGTPTWLLIGLQAFRLPLELLMHQAAAEGVMPGQMSFGTTAGQVGLNYDVVTGATALVLGVVFFGREVPRALALAWNVMGLGLLLNVVTVAIVSTPMLARFGDDPAHLNTFVLRAPFVWLPAVLVGSAALGHLLLFRRLLGKVSGMETAALAAR